MESVLQLLCITYYLNFITRMADIYLNVRNYKYFLKNEEALK